MVEKVMKGGGRCDLRDKLEIARSKPSETVWNQSICVQICFQSRMGLLRICESAKFRKCGGKG